MPGEDLVLDRVLSTNSDDRFDHEAIATVVAELATNGVPPLNIALWGPWGSGKSSFLGLVREKIEGPKPGGPTRVAHYDAWKYGGRALKKHFVKSVAEELNIPDERFNARIDRDHENSKLDLRAWVRENKGSLLFGLLLALTIAAIWFLVVGALHLLLNLHDAAKFWHRINDSAAFAADGVGPVLALAFAALVVGPKMLETAVVKFTDKAPETDDEFAKRFSELVNRATKDGCERLVVFIDELDRCSPQDVVATLVDLKTFLDVEGCVFIVAADREVLESALKKVPQATPVREEDPYYSTPGAFLDKIFQHRIPLPPLRTQALTKFARELVEKQGGLWSELRHAEPDDRLFLQVIYTLIPAHVRSPRRAKALLNNYATNVRIAAARGIDWLSRADEIACLTVLQTEFPSVADELMRIPLLLTYLRGDQKPPKSDEVGGAVEAYSPRISTDDDDPSTGEPAGTLLPSRDRPSDGETAAREHANGVLNAQLRSYLRKVAAQNVTDPRPDLFYLQSAGWAVGITDPELGYILDLAADLSASEVVERFDGQPSATVGQAVRVLVQYAENERGPGRSSLIEAACRLAERLDNADLRQVAGHAAGGVLAQIGTPDWPSEATPGALRLGVIGENHDVVESLLRNVAADELAEAGTLERFVPVLGLANPVQTALIRQLLVSVYETHPAPLHSAIREAPLDAAIALLDDTYDDVGTVLERLAASHADAASTEPPPEVDSPGSRWAALLASASARDDDAGALISQILELAQRSTDASIDEQRTAREDDALEQISDEARLNLHALLGLQLAALEHAEFWMKYLTDGPTHPELAEAAFKRLVAAIPTQAMDLAVELGTVAQRVVPHLSEDFEEASSIMQAALASTPWPNDQDDTRRSGLHAVAHMLAQRIGEPDAVEQVLVDDIIGGISAAPTSEPAQDLSVELIGDLTPTAAQGLETALFGRPTTTADVVMTLRVRLAAAANTGTNPLAAVDILATQGIQGDQRVFAEWLRLQPPVSEVQAVLDQIAVDHAATGRYSKDLDLPERTALWIDLEMRGWDVDALRPIGQHGVGASAVEHIATRMLAPSQQQERDNLAARLATAKLNDSAALRASTKLVQALLATPVQGNVGTAARVAIASGGVAYGKAKAVRDQFEAATDGKRHLLTASETKELKRMQLLKRGWFSL